MHADARLYQTLREEATMLDHVLELLADYRSQRQQGNSPLACQTWTLPAGGQSVSLFTNAAGSSGSSGSSATSRKNSGDVNNHNHSTGVHALKHRCIRVDDDSQLKENFTLQQYE